VPNEVIQSFKAALLPIEKRKRTVAYLGSHLENVVFILSSGRTGTTAMARYLSECCEGTLALHEPKPSRILRMASSRRLARRLTNEQMSQMLRRKRQRLVSQIDQPNYVESNPYLYGFVEVLGEVFQRPKVIHVVRDPRTMIRSALNFGAQSGIKRIVTALLPYWLIKPDRVEENPERRWRDMSAVERIAWYWRTVNSHLDQGSKVYGDDYTRVRYEDLFSSDGAGIRQLIEKLGLEERPGVLEELLASRVNRSRGNVMPAWPDWPEADCKALDHQCGELMRQYGYAADSLGTIEAAQ